MKRARFLAMTLVVAIMMMGAGYAYWQEQLTISNTIDTGVLDVVFVEPTTVGSDNYTGENEGMVVANSDGHSLQLQFKEVYPGADCQVAFNLSNIGTLAAFVDEFRITNDPDNIADVILCKGVDIEGYSSNYSGNTLEDALNYINGKENGKGIRLENDGAANSDRKVTLSLEFNTLADDNTLPQDQEFSFTIIADVFQYNAR